MDSGGAGIARGRLDASAGTDYAGRSMVSDLERAALLRQLNSTVPPHGRLEHLGSTPFGPLLQVQRYRLANGLDLLLCEDHSAPVVAYHTWYRVGSRHERTGKTGLAHLFEHLMFNEMEGCPYGEFDRRLEEAGAENNASTWLDWTHYTIAAPADQLPLVIELESLRMSRLVLQDAQVTSEKEVVANERRFRVEDDVEGAVSELLWANAYERHPYRQPTIGWMADIEGFTTEDCRDFYRTYYAPNNATLVVVGNVTERALLERVAQAYGERAPSALPPDDVWPDPPRATELRLEVTKPTPTDKVLIGYRGPALGDQDWVATSLLSEILSGGRASRLHRLLVRDRELASDVRVFVGPFRDPGLVEVFANARTGHSADILLAAIDEVLARLVTDLVEPAELERARARTELSLLRSLETAEGKAATIGFYAAVLGQPGAAFERLEQLRALTPSDVRWVARRYLDGPGRTVLLVRAGASEASPPSGAREEPSS